MRYRTPAKLNLFLHVTGRRDDGYHDIETAFQLVDLQDELIIESRTDGRIVREPAPSDPLLSRLSDEQDLSVRAARLLQQASGSQLGASIHIEKRIPAGAGLGGGSSDGACVLKALNAQWGLHWPVERLAELGLQLGSDVPVFVHGRNAFGSGRGEQLTPLQLARRWFVIVDPGVQISTRELFAAAELTRDTPPLTMRAVPAGGGHNAFEPGVRARYPQVQTVCERRAHWQPRLTGTGAAVFTAFEAQDAAERLAAELAGQWRCWVARGLDC